jgi:hypothetical protein
MKWSSYRMFLFFVRHFNDIDHLAPIAWRMKQAGHPVAVYGINPRYDYNSDYRLMFLKGQGVDVAYLHDRFSKHHGGFHDALQRGLLRFHSIERNLSRQKRETSFRRQLLAFLSGQVGVLLYKINRLCHYNVSWARSILRQTQARAVCFDHIMPSLYVVKPFLKAAKSLSIPSFALPHGVHLYTNQKTKAKSKDSRRLAKFNRFDHVIVPNQLRKDQLVQSGVDGGRIAVLGSARYCEQWLTQNQKIIPRTIGKTGRGPQELKVVFMPSKPQCLANVKRLRATCDLLAETEGIDVRIKPHTRTGGERHLFAANKLRDASATLTAELCEWADVALVVGSSVITEALMRKKTVLYLKYLHNNTTLSEELGACRTIYDEEELRQVLTSLRAEGNPGFYSEASVTKFISDIVHGGMATDDVLGSYEAFLTAHSGPS